jgi:hypothetical protein
MKSVLGNNAVRIIDEFGFNLDIAKMRKLVREDFFVIHNTMKKLDNIEPLYIMYKGKYNVIGHILKEKNNKVFVSGGLSYISMDSEFKDIIMEHENGILDQKEKLSIIRNWLCENNVSINNENWEFSCFLFNGIMESLKLRKISAVNSSINSSIFYDLIEKFTNDGISVQNWSIRGTTFSKFLPSYGIKTSPLTINNLQNIKSLKNKFWREYHILTYCDVLLQNGISVYYSSCLGWSILQSHDPEMLFANDTNKIKYAQSKIVKSIIGELERTRYKLKKNIDQLTVYIERLDKKIHIPLIYAEKHLIYSNYVSCLYIKKRGRSISNYHIGILNLLYGATSTAIVKFYVDLYKNSQALKNIMFMCVYNLHCLFKYFGIIHNDLHLGNITIVGLDNKDTDYSLFITDNDSYLLNYNSCISCIIDFGRSLLSKDELKNKAYSYTDFLELFNSQKESIINIYQREFPEFHKSFKNQLETIIDNNYNEFIKNYSGYDTYRFFRLFAIHINRLMFDIKEDIFDKHMLNTEIIPFCETIANRMAKLLTTDVIEGNFIDSHSLILKEYFDDFSTRHIFKGSEKLTIIGVFDATVELYNNPFYNHYITADDTIDPEEYRKEETHNDEYFSSIIDSIPPEEDRITEYINLPPLPSEIEEKKTEYDIIGGILNDGSIF